MTATTLGSDIEALLWMLQHDPEITASYIKSMQESLWRTVTAERAPARCEVTASDINTALHVLSIVGVYSGLEIARKLPTIATEISYSREFAEQKVRDHFITQDALED